MSAQGTCSTPCSASEAGFFWGLHTIHHSSEYYNLSTALRQAAIQDLGLALYDVLQAFCIPPPIFLVHRYFSEIFQFWLHTSVSAGFPFWVARSRFLPVGALTKFCV